MNYFKYELREALFAVQYLRFGINNVRCFLSLLSQYGSVLAQYWPRLAREERFETFTFDLFAVHLSTRHLQLSMALARTIVNSKF